MKYEGRNIVYEVGDFIVFCADNANGGDVRYWKRGMVYKVTDGGSSYLSVERLDNGVRNGWCIEKFRPATQEEIDKATGNEKIMVGEYVVNFDTMGGVTDSIGVGCVTVDKELFLKIGKKAGWK